jgi:hypothetical protein
MSEIIEIPKRELSPQAIQTLTSIVSLRKLDTELEPLLDESKRLFTEHQSNFDGEWGEFQLGHLVSAARFSLHKEELQKEYGFSDEYCATSLAYRLSYETLLPTSMNIRADSVGMTGLQDEMEFFLKRQASANRAKREMMLHEYPEALSKSVLEEELFYTVHQWVNQDRRSWGVDTPVSYSLDDTYLTKSPEEYSFLATDGKYRHDQTFGGGFHEIESGICAINVHDIRKAVPGNPNLAIVQYLYHEIAMHAANTFVLKNSPDMNREFSFGSNDYGKFTSAEKRRLKNRYSVGLFEAIASKGDSDFAQRIGREPVYQSVFGGEQQIDTVLSTIASYKRFRVALDQAVHQLAESKGLQDMDVWSTVFRYHQMGYMESMTQYLDQLGDATGFFLSHLDHDQAIHAEEYLNGDSSRRVRILVGMFHASGLHKGLYRANQETIRQFGDQPMTHIRPDEAYRYGWQRLADFKVMPDSLSAWAAMEGRRKREYIPEKVGQGMKTVTMLLHGGISERIDPAYQQSITDSSLRKSIRDIAERDPSGLTLVSEIRKAAINIAIHKQQEKGNMKEYAYDRGNALSGQIESYFGDLYYDTPAFLMGMVQGCDEFTSAVLDYVQFQPVQTSRTTG